jgi:RNA:NAD 2'-phosphotransferase (TPT1/KptA family)
MSITWTPVPIPNATVELLTESNSPLLTEDGVVIIISEGDVWTEDTVPTSLWTKVTPSADSWTKVNG